MHKGQALRRLVSGIPDTHDVAVRVQPSPRKMRPGAVRPGAGQAARPRPVLASRAASPEKPFPTSHLNMHERIQARGANVPADSARNGIATTPVTRGRPGQGAPAFEVEQDYQTEREGMLPNSSRTPSQVWDVAGAQAQASALANVPEPSLEVRIFEASLAGVMILTLVVLMALSVSWGFEADAEVDKCLQLSCSDCAAKRKCIWCDAPSGSGARLPGLCEDASTYNSSHDGTSSCSAKPSAAQCASSAAAGDKWGQCDSSTNAACTGEVGCELCDSGNCVPLVGNTSGAFAANASFCGAGATYLRALRPEALTPASPACFIRGSNVSSAIRCVQHRHPTISHPRMFCMVLIVGGWHDSHIDRGAELYPGVADQHVRLVANGTFVEGIQCRWAIECPFNATVEVRFKQVSIRSGERSTTASKLFLLANGTNDTDRGLHVCEMSCHRGHPARL